VVTGILPVETGWHWWLAGEASRFRGQDASGYFRSRAGERNPGLR